MRAWLLVTVLWAGLAIEAIAAPAAKGIAPQGSIQGSFSIPVSDSQGRLQALFSGREMKPQAGGMVLVTQFKMTNREPALMVEAPECLFTLESFAASSAGSIKVSMPDGRFTLEGVGFAWLHQAFRLMVTNGVRTRIQGDLRTAFALTPPGPARTNTPAVQIVDIDAGEFSFDGRAGIARYAKEVRVKSATWELRCDVLSGSIPASGAMLTNLVAEGQVRMQSFDPARPSRLTGSNALFSAVSGIEELVVNGNPEWETGVYRGRSGQLIFREQGGIRTVRALGNAYLRVPRPQSMTNATAAAPPASDIAGSRTAANSAPGQSQTGKDEATTATNRFVEIECANYELRPGELLFRGGVIAREGTTRLDCETLRGTVDTDGDRLKDLTAEGRVKIQMTEGPRQVEARGERVTYVSRPDGDRVEVWGSPRWKSGPFEGQSDKLRVDVKSGGYEAQADGNALVRIPRSMMGHVELLRNRPSAADGKHGSSAAVDGPIEIHAAACSLQPGRVVFQDSVRVENLPGKLTTDRLTAGFAGATNQLESLTAEGRVEFRQAQAVVTCESLRGSRGEGAESIDKFAAEGEVRLSMNRGNGQDEAAGARAEIDVPSAVVNLHGNPSLRTSEGLRITGARELRWDAKRGKFAATGPFLVDGPSAALENLKPRPVKPESVVEPAKQ